MKSNKERNNSDSGCDVSDRKRLVGLIYDERMCKHFDTQDDNHPENPKRILAIWDKLQSAGITQRCVVMNAVEAEDKYVALVHSKQHIELVQGISSKKFDSRRNSIAKKFDSVYFNEGSTEAAYLAAGSVIEVAERVAKGDLDSGFSIVRPPGHHAEVDQPMGFCLFNNVAIATSFLLNERTDLGIKKILIVDWDIHHGNGAQKMFWKDPRVLFFSVHRYEDGSFYPIGDDGSCTMVGEGNGAGYNINVPWQNDGCGDADYLAVWEHVLIPVTKEFNPDMIIISAGFDAAMNDPLGGCRVTPSGYAVMLKQFANGKIVLALEGGYNLDSLANSVVSCIQVLLNETAATACSEAPLESTWVVIQTVRKTLCAFWPSLGDKLPENLISRKTLRSQILEDEHDKGLHAVKDNEKLLRDKTWTTMDPRKISYPDVITESMVSCEALQRLKKRKKGGISQAAASKKHKVFAPSPLITTSPSVGGDAPSPPPVSKFTSRPSPMSPSRPQDPSSGVPNEEDVAFELLRPALLRTEVKSALALGDPSSSYGHMGLLDVPYTLPSGFEVTAETTLDPKVAVELLRPAIRRTEVDRAHEYSPEQMREQMAYHILKGFSIHYALGLQNIGLLKANDLLTREKRDLKDEVTRLTKDYDRVAKENHVLTFSQTRLRGEKATLAKEIDILSEEKASFVVENARLLAESKEKIVQLEEMNHQNQFLQYKNSLIASEARKARDTIDELNRKNERLEKENKNLNLALSQALAAQDIAEKDVAAANHIIDIKNSDVYNDVLIQESVSILRAFVQVLMAKSQNSGDADVILAEFINEHIQRNSPDGNSPSI